MGEFSPMFLKANIKNQGYVYVWSDTTKVSFEEQALDEMLPALDSSLNTHTCIAFTSTRISQSQIMLIVGGYWKDRKDEHGRSGLRFWCGVLVDEVRIDNNTLWQLSNILLGMLQRFEIGFEEIGDIVADLAKKKQDVNWVTPILKLMRNTPPVMDEFSKRLVLSFMENKKQFDSKVNFRLHFPIHTKVAVPCMLSKLLFQPGIQKIGGGNLLVGQLTAPQFISTESDIAGYKVLVINDLIEPLRIVEKRLPQPTSSIDNASSSLWQVILNSIGFIILIALLLAILFVVWQFIK